MISKQIKTANQLKSTILAALPGVSGVYDNSFIHKKALQVFPLNPSNFMNILSMYYMF